MSRPKLGMPVNREIDKIPLRFDLHIGKNLIYRQIGFMPKIVPSFTDKLALCPRLRRQGAELQTILEVGHRGDSQFGKKSSHVIFLFFNNTNCYFRKFDGLV